MGIANWLCSFFLTLSQIQQRFVKINEKYFTKLLTLWFFGLSLSCDRNEAGTKRKKKTKRKWKRHSN